MVQGPTQGRDQRPTRIAGIERGVGLNDVVDQPAGLGAQRPLSVVAGIPAAYALARFEFPYKNGFAFVLMSFRFVPFIAFVIPLYLLYQQIGLYNTHAGLIFAYQLITLPFTIWMLRSFFMEIPTEIQEAAKIDGCS